MTSTAVTDAGPLPARAGVRTGFALPAAVFVVLVTNGLTDSYFRDEFYYLACARRLAWGYVDHPPLSVALLALVTGVFGDSLLVLRIAAATIAGSTVWLTGRLARRLGGGGFAQTLAMLSAAVAPVLLAIGTFYSMNVLEILIWTATAYVFIGVLDRPSRGRWLMLGVLLGLGLLNKISVLWLGAGIAVGVLLFRRSLLTTAGPWLAAGVAGMFMLPHVAWQVAHGWPTIEFIRNASAQKMAESTPAQFLVDQVMNMHPLTAPIWVAGLLFLLFAEKARPYRALACVYLIPLGILLLNRTSRSVYLAPAYPVLFAAGSMALSPLFATRGRRAIAISVLVLAGLLTLPLAVPLLPTDRYVAYAGALGVTPSTEEKKDLGRLPQFFADREGWPQLVDAVMAAWYRLPEHERPRAAVFAGNYGEAGAIELLARDHDIPVMSGHNNYWLWGPPVREPDTILVLSRSREPLEAWFASIEEIGRIDCGDCMPYENGQFIYAGRGLKASLSGAWAELRHYD